MLEFACTQVTEVFCAFGLPGVRAEQVADRAIDQAREWLHSGTAVAEHLADQLLLPLAMAGGGSFTTPRMTEHLESNIQVLRQFLPIDIRCSETASGALLVELAA